MDDRVISKVFLDTDFKDRTVLKIITQNGYAVLMQNPKVNILLEEIWVGKNSYECDGRTTDYSMLTFYCIFYFIFLIIIIQSNFYQERQ